MAFFDPHIFRESCSQLRPVRQERHRVHDLQEFLRLVEGIFATSKNGHVLFTIEKSVTDGTVAHTMTFEFGHPHNRMLVTGRARRHNAGLSTIFPRNAFRHKFRAVKHQIRHFVIGNLCAKVQSLFLADVHQGFARKRLFQAIIILDHVRLGKRTTILSNQLHAKSSTQAVERGRNSRGSVTKN